MMNFENIIVEINHQTATIIINRPKKLNSLNKLTIQELHTAFYHLDNDADIRVILITGSGEKAFVAGADIAEFADFDAEEGSNLAKVGQEVLFNFVENLSTPVIALINGFALGGGLELAMASHIRIASENARMGLPETSLGLIPGYGGTQRLPQLVGKGRALELIMTAGMITSQQALQYGLVNYVSSQEDLMTTAIQLANKIIKNSPMAIGKAIQAVNAGFNSQEGYQEEIKQFGLCFDTEDFEEGTTAFLAKRRPNF